MSEKNKNTLIHVWESNKAKLRLISYANTTPGYHDGYILEKAHKDALGVESWTEVRRWEATTRSSIDDNGYRSALADAVRALAADLERLKLTTKAIAP